MAELGTWRAGVTSYRMRMQACTRMVLSAVFTASCGKTAPTTPSQTPAVLLTVSGMIRTASGAPLTDARVYGGYLSSKTGPVFNSISDAGGRYRGELPAGTNYEILAQRAGFEEQRRTFSLTSDAVLDFTLQPGIAISGLVTEAGVGPLENATVEVIAGPSAGAKGTTGPPGVPGRYIVSHVLPGDITVRASKAGYESVEQRVHADESTSSVDFSLKWAYGTCLRSVSPVLFDQYLSAGGRERVVVDAAPDRRWTVIPDVPWLQASAEPHTGSGAFEFTVLPHDPPAVDFRRGALMIRCSETEGQNVWVSQFVRCDVHLDAAADSASIFPSSGGQGHLKVHTATPGCHWLARSTTDWIRPVGVSSWYGDLDVYFVVAANPDTRQRMGTFTVGETVWTVTQQ